MPAYWLWLTLRSGIGEKTRRKLLDLYGTPEAVYRQREYSKVSGLTGRGLKSLMDKDLSGAQKVLTDCAEKGVSILTLSDRNYPSRLKNIFDPPLVLYYRGTLPDFEVQPVIGMVGTRSATEYGRNAAGRMGYDVGAAGVLVVSGLAEGIDSAAMDGALQAGGTVVGVLGCGVDVVYPKFNGELYALTEQHGCLMSEYPPGTAPISWHFLQRNRIISGLSHGIVVVEAPMRSGSMNTARNALEQGRDVFVVPGNIDQETFFGSNQLLRDGATPAFGAEDVLREYAQAFPGMLHREGKLLGFQPREEKPHSVPAQRRQSEGRKEGPQKKDIDNPEKTTYIDLETNLQGLSSEELTIVRLLGNQERLLDDVIAEAGLPSASVIGLVTMLELKQIVTRLPGRRLRRK